MAPSIILYKHFKGLPYDFKQFYMSSKKPVLTLSVDCRDKPVTVFGQSCHKAAPLSIVGHNNA